MIPRVILAIQTRAMKAYLSRGIFKTIGAFQRQLWSAALAFFRGETDAFQFIDDYVYSIGNQLGKAWREGARDVGVDPRDFADEDLAKLDAIIASEHEYILGLATDIENARIAGYTLDEFRTGFYSRVDLWVNRYNETVNAARIWFGGRQKLEWVLGATEKHCLTCSKLNGMVAYASEWQASGFQPQAAPNTMLECGGWRCDCELKPTDKRRSPKALETLMNIAGTGS